MMTEPLSLQMIERGNTIAVISFNRPEARNALTLAMMHQFAAMVDELARHPTLGAVILTGAGEVAFCAGGDLSDLRDLTTEADGAQVATIMGDALHALENLPVPVIGAINGYALGGGSEIALACDIRVVDNAVKFGLIHKNLALIPGWGGGQRLLRAVGYSRAMTMLLRGDILDCEMVHALKLAHEVVPKGEAYPYALEMAETFIDEPRELIQAIKSILRAGTHQPYDDALSAERAAFPALWAAEPHLDAVQRFLRRKQS